MAAVYQGRGTATGRALDVVRTSVLTAAGGYRGGKAVVVVITDGQTQETADVLQTAAEQLQSNSFVSVFTLGIGGEANQTELAIIASQPLTNFVYLVADFDELSTHNFVLGVYSESFCLAPQTTTSTATTQTNPITTQGISTRSACEPADVVFVLDSSASVGAAGWELVKASVSNVLESFQINAGDGIRCDITRLVERGCTYN